MITSVAQRWRKGRAHYRPAGEVIDTRRYDVAPIDEDTPAKDFVLAHHYAGTYPAARFRFGLFFADELAGVAVFSQPSNNLSLRPLPGSHVEGVELGRFVLRDDVPGNGETWFLARAFELLRRESLVGVVSFSDPLPRTDAGGDVVFKGHVGTIYQAFNATYLGRARAGSVRLLPDGRVLHNRALAKVRNRERGMGYVIDALCRYGAERPRGDLDVWLSTWVKKLTRTVAHPGNHKYVWTFNRRVRKHVLAVAPPKAYPKFHALP